ncbi:MAG: hypothetical protein KGQ95_06715, partial [Acidobacteria bacterium]|nr:hypothetical protein [Acidobacteriota bacterium]
MKVMLAEVVAVMEASAGFTEVIDAVLVGAVMSTVYDRVAGVPTLPTASTSRTDSACAPSERFVKAR